MGESKNRKEVWGLLVRTRRNNSRELLPRTAPRSRRRPLENPNEALFLPFLASLLSDEACSSFPLAPPPSCVCSKCKREFKNVEKDKLQLKMHVDSKHPKD